MEPRKEVLDLFLCHNGADKDWVRKLAEQFESETFDGLPSGRPLKAFFDEWDINIGENVIVRINQGLSAARYVALVISPEFLAAPWPTLEWTHVVADDPVNRKGRIVPLYFRDYSEASKQRAELPAPLKALNWIDFRRPADFNRSFQRLMRKVRDQPPVRGTRRPPLAALSPAMPLPAADDTSAAPDRVSEAILGNLLPVESYPGTIWSAPTAARRNKEVWEKIPEAVAFELQETRLYTFADLTAETQPLRSVIDTTDIQSHAVGRWKDDPVRWRWCMTLLNKCLSKHLHTLPIRRDERGRFFFKPKDGGEREWQNGKDPARGVAAKKSNADGTRSFWVHQGAHLAFQALGERLFLCIDPCYVFTSDGKIPLGGRTVGPLSIKWGGKERNAAILRHIVFWSRTLGRGRIKIELATGGAPIVLSGIPALARTSFGVEFDQIGFGSLLAQVEDELSIAAEMLGQSLDVSATLDESEEDSHEH